MCRTKFSTSTCINSLWVFGARALAAQGPQQNLYPRVLHRRPTDSMLTDESFNLIQSAASFGASAFTVTQCVGVTFPLPVLMLHRSDRSVRMPIVPAGLASLVAPVSRIRCSSTGSSVLLREPGMTGYASEYTGWLSHVRIPVARL